MKKYKHKQTGDVAVQKLSTPEYYWCEGTEIHARIVENSSDWEQFIIDETIGDFEILEFSSKAWGEKIVKLNTDTKRYELDENTYWEIDNMLDLGISVLNEDVEIHSVRRIKDNQIFSIGDPVMYNKEENGYKNIISKMIIEKGNIIVFYGRTKDELQYLTKVENPLFITTDNYLIYEGQEYYYIDAKNQNNFLTEKVNSTNSKNQPLGIKQFASLNNVLQYLKLSERKFSYNDIKEICDKSGTDKLLEILKENCK